MRFLKRAREAASRMLIGICCQSWLARYGIASTPYFSRINVVSTLWINVEITWWINVEITLIRRWKWNKIRRWIFNIAQRWYNISARRWNNVETTLHNVKKTLQNVGTTLIQRCFNLALTLVKPILSLIGLVMIVDCVTVIHVQYMNSFYSAIWGSIFLLYINNWTTNEISKNFLTVAHNVIHNVGNNDDLCRSLKCCI